MDVLQAVHPNNIITIPANASVQIAQKQMVRGQQKEQDINNEQAKVVTVALVVLYVKIQHIIVVQQDIMARHQMERLDVRLVQHQEPHLQVLAV